MTPSMQALARIKLTETRRQRDRLNALYDAIERRAAEAPDPLARLRALHEGLKNVTFARRPLHPDVANLDVLLLADHLGVAPPGLVAERTGLLERELAQGRLRAEFTYAFGRVVGEWAGPAPVPELPPAEGDADPATLLFQDAPLFDRAYFDGLFGGLAGALRPVRAAVERFGASDVFRPIRDDEAKFALGRCARDPYALPGFRQQAAAALANDAVVHEYAGVLTILLNNLDGWDWPDEGVPLRRVWARMKYRPYVDEDLITALFLGVIGRRWGEALKPLLVWQALKDGDRPVFPPEPPSSPLARVAEARLHRQSRLFLAAAALDEAGGYGPDEMLDALATVEAELRLSRAFGEELFAAQADITDFYPSLSHEMLLDVLSRVGVPPRWLEFFRRFLKVPIRGARRLRRGLPLKHTLADVFAECLLWAMDLSVWKASRTQLIRVVDDAWLVAPTQAQALNAWGEIGAFCRAAGLEVNAAKSGSVGLSATASLPHWGLLRLRPEGMWEVNEEAFARVEATIRAHLAAAPSVLEFVNGYNGYVQFLLGKLAPSLALDDGHLRRVAGRLERMHENLFGPGVGVGSEVRRRVGGSFADARLAERGVPEALIYWPITAGGLGLLHPVLFAATYVGPRARWVPPPTPADVINVFLRSLGVAPLSADEAAMLPPGPALRAPRRADVARFLEARPGTLEGPTQAALDAQTAEEWERFYENVAARIDPADPAPMPAMERLVSDFIGRGGEVSGRPQAGLTPYWRWVVYAYGPSLLESLGTFRFLMTELVPLQLILEIRRGSGSELREEPGAAAESEDIPF